MEIHAFHLSSITKLVTLERMIHCKEGKEGEENKSKEKGFERWHYGTAVNDVLARWGFSKSPPVHF